MSFPRKHGASRELYVIQGTGCVRMVRLSNEGTGRHMANDTTVTDEYDDGEYDASPGATERWVVVTRDGDSGHHRGSRPMTRDSAERLRDELVNGGKFAGVTLEPYNVDAPTHIRATETR